VKRITLPKLTFSFLKHSSRHDKSPRGHLGRLQHPDVRGRLQCDV